jgi:membrane-bound lytic murein transglycosylase D
MLTGPRPIGLAPLAIALLLALAVAPVPAGPGAAAPAPAPSPAIEPEAPPAAQPGEATSFIDARDSYERAQALYRSNEYAKALGEVDDAIRSLNFVLTRSEDPSIRRAAGDLLRRVGSLRLACSRGLDKEKQQILLVGPPAPPASEKQGSPAPPASGASAASDAGAPNGSEAVSDGDSQRDEGAAEGDPGTPGGPSLDASASAPEIEAVDNSRVQKWVDFYTGRGRATFEKWLKRSGLYMEWMKGILKSEGLPTDLVHLVFVESGFNPNAHSRSHAVGPWQFIRGTAKLFGLKVDSWIDERKDPERATLAAARYLKHLYALFESWPLALAGYNAGEGTVVRAISRQGTKDFWQLDLPAQTRDYVPQFLACLSIARQPERYGFETVERDAPLAFDTVQIPGPVDLNAIAAACGASLETLRVLNPAVLRYAAPGDPLGTVTLRVPAGSGETLLDGLRSGAISLPAVRTPPDAPSKRHKVRRGESLVTIAHRYGVDVDELASVNGLATKAHLRRGQMLRVPRGDAYDVPRFPSKPLAQKPSAKGRASAAARSGAGVAHLYGGTKTVRIQPGDTLAEIADRYGTDVRTLRVLNGLRPRQNIKAGAKLKVPVDDES